MRSIDSEIEKGSFKRVYLLFGNEHYLLARGREKLLAALGVKDKTDMNYSCLDQNSFSVDALIADSDTLPFFAERRVILVMNSGFFKGNKKDKDRLVKYIADIPQTTVIVFVDQEVDKRDRLYKAVSKNGTAEEYKLPQEKELIGWIGGRLKEYGLSMKRDAWDEFYLRTGSSMDLMDQEFEKLAAYCMNKKLIEKKDVEDICANASETIVFALTDAIAARDATRVFNVYQDMLRQNEPAPVIFSLIERQFMQLLQLKRMGGVGASSDLKKKVTGVKNDWALGKLERSAQRFSEAELMHLLSAAAEYEEGYKRSRINDHLAVELLITEAIKKPRPE
ncbi:MAG: DNA polymerase III subunit delta [Lachnospiraceae bacterium]|nr:DNA polymerase III subunit delta [Lachnospiraceae bacterium]